MFALDSGPREGPRKAAAGQDMIHGNVISVAIENLKLRCLDINRAHQQADWTLSETAEIHIFRKESSNRRDVIEVRQSPRRLLLRQPPERPEKMGRTKPD